MPGFRIEQTALLAVALLTTTGRIPYPGILFTVPKLITKRTVENQNFLTPCLHTLGKTPTV